MANIEKGKSPASAKWKYIVLALWAFGIAIYILKTQAEGKSFLGGTEHNIVAMVILFLLGRWLFSQGRKFCVGDAGESTALNRISSLPNAYTVFTNVQIQIGNRLGEIDEIVVGPTGVFAIEVKNHKGTITANGNGDWHQQNGKYSRTFMSPIKQVHRNVGMLIEMLKTQNVRAWIEPYVFFTDNASEIINAPERCTQNIDEIKQFILSNQPKNGLLETEKINEICSAIRNIMNGYAILNGESTALDRAIARTYATKKEKPKPVQSGKKQKTTKKKTIEKGQKPLHVEKPKKPTQPKPAKKKPPK